MPENKQQKTRADGSRPVPVNITEGLEEAYTYLEDLSTKSGLYHMRTGCVELDNVFNFLNGGELVFIAGGPGVGKSTLAMSLAQHLATIRQIRCGIFSLEMPVAQYVARMICSQSKVDLAGVEDGSLRVADWQSIVKSCDKLSALGIYLDDSASLDIDELSDKAHKLKRTQDIQLLVVDSIDLLESTTRPASKTVASLKHLARELGILVLVTGQGIKAENTGKNRSVEIDWSGAATQFADVVLFINRQVDEATEKSITQLTVAKNRFGATGVRTNLEFNPELFRFEFASRKDDEPDV